MKKVTSVVSNVASKSKQSKIEVWHCGQLVEIVKRLVKGSANGHKVSYRGQTYTVNPPFGISEFPFIYVSSDVANKVLKASNAAA